MASINLSGVLDTSIGGFDVGGRIQITHVSTTGQTLKHTVSEVIIPPDGAYDIDLNYGNVRFDYTSLNEPERFLAIVTVNQDSTATTLPELLNAAVPPTDEQLLLFQDILADTVQAKDDAEQAALSAISAIKSFTLGEAIAKTDANIGQRVRIEDRANGLFEYNTGQTSNAYNVIEASGSGLQLVLITNPTLNTLEWGLNESNTAAQNSAIMQAAIDYGNNLWSVNGGLGGGGVWVHTPAGAYDIEGFEDKQGVNRSGDGSTKTVFQVVGSNLTAMYNRSSITQSSADQISYFKIKGMSIVPKDPITNLPSGVVIWDTTGYSRVTAEDIFIGWCGGVTGVRMTGATTAGAGGPANWYNNFYDMYVERPSAWPTGGIGWLLGDTAADKEQITTWGVFGGRTSGAGSGAGISVQSCNSLNFYNHVVESCDVLIGSAAGPRQAIGVNFYPAYFEGGAGANLTISSSADGTGLFGEFITGYTVTDDGANTQRLGSKIFKTHASNTGTNFWQVNIENGASRRPEFIGSTQPGIDLTNSIGTDLTIQNSSSTGSSTSFFRFAWNSLANILYSFGTTEFTGGSDGVVNVGSASNRFNTVYAAVGAINTSDEREKQQVKSLSDAEKAVALKLKSSIKTFKFNDAVNLKGDKARIHCGVMAQEVVSIFGSEGLDATKYALLCYDEWEDEFETLPETLNPDGSILEAERVVKRRSAGNRYGVRYEELLAFIISAL